MKFLVLLCLAVPVLEAAQFCQPDSHGVRRYNAQPCASTTRYVDGHRGACGCGPANSDTPYSWNMQEYMTAPSERYFDNGGSSLWCGHNCGKCVRLTPTVPVLEAAQLCQPDSHGVRRYNGKACASTTRHDDGTKGWCGCGPDNNTDTPFLWNLQGFTTAASERYYQIGRSPSRSRCGTNCGTCVRLTPTGGFVPGKGNSPPNHNPVTFLITNICPVDIRQEWCTILAEPGTNQHNAYGYEVHFNLQNHAGQVSMIGWDNPEVTWEEVPCPSDLQNDYSQCQCYH